MKNYYLPEKTTIKSIDKLTDKLAIFRLAGQNLNFLPGQFFMLSIPGFGEAPFTPTNYPDKKSIQFLVRSAGVLTAKLFFLKPGNNIFIRGPYGNPFPLDKFQDKNILLVAGGCGLAPINSLLEYLYKKNNCQNVQLIYGVNTQKEIAFKKELLSKKNKVEILITIAKPDKNYRGNVGFVDSLITKNIVKKESIAVLCGPPVMYKIAIKKLLFLGIKKENIYLQLERKMQCGIGLCQHCTCGKKYVCLDGPVFTYQEILEMKDEI